MKKGIIVAVATLAMGLTGLFATPAKALQFGFNAGYSSVGFQLHGAGGEFLLGFGGQDEHRPQGSVLRIGLASAAGSGETDLTKATWSGFTLSGQSYNAFATAVGQGSLQAGQTAIAGGALAGYGITDLTKAKGSATAFIISAAYEYVLPQGAPGLGFIAGAEVYISEGGYAGNTGFADARTEGGIGGGGVVGISYYLKNGFNMTVKTGLGVIDPGKVTYAFPNPAAAGTTLPVTVEPELSFYASPTFALGFIY